MEPGRQSRQRSDCNLTGPLLVDHRAGVLDEMPSSFVMQADPIRLELKSNKKYCKLIKKKTARRKRGQWYVLLANKMPGSGDISLDHRDWLIIKKMPRDQAKKCENILRFERHNAAASWIGLSVTDRILASSSFGASQPKRSYKHSRKKYLKNCKMSRSETDLRSNLPSEWMQCLRMAERLVIWRYWGNRLWPEFPKFLETRTFLCTSCKNIATSLQGCYGNQKINVSFLTMDNLDEWLCLRTVLILQCTAPNQQAKKSHSSFLILQKFTYL